MIIKDMQIDETQVLDSYYVMGSKYIFTISDLIDYVLKHPDEFHNFNKVEVDHSKIIIDPDLDVPNFSAPPVT